MGGPVGVLVNAPLVDETSFYIVSSVLGRFGWNVEAPGEVRLHKSCPIRKSDLVDTSMWELALSMEVGQESEYRVLEADKLYWGSVSWSRRDSFVDQGRRPHLVHPSATVVCIAAEAETCLLKVSSDLHVKAIVFHLVIDAGPCVQFTEPDTCGVGFQNLHHELFDCHHPLAFKLSFKTFLKNTVTIFYHLDVVFDRLQEEPRGISCIKTCIVTAVVQIRDQAVALNPCEKEDSVLGLLEESRREQETP